MSPDWWLSSRDTPLQSNMKSVKRKAVFLINVRLTLVYIYTKISVGRATVSHVDTLHLLVY